MEMEKLKNKGKIIINDTWKGNDSVVLKKEDKYQVRNFDKTKSVYFYQIEQISKNILSGRKKVLYPGMDFEETLFNMKIIDNWINE